MNFKAKMLVIALGAMSAIQAQAMTQGTESTQSNSFYFGASYIRAMYYIDEAAQNAIVFAGLPTGATATAKFNNTDNGYEVHAGYMFMPNFGVELGYADLGKFTQTLAISSGTPVVVTNQTYTFATTAFTASVIGAYQLEGGLSLFGRLAGMYTTTKPTMSQGAITTSVYTKNEYNKFVPGAGIGAAFNINDQFRVRAEFDYWYQPTDTDVIATKDLRNIVVGADVSFY